MYELSEPMRWGNKYNSMREIVSNGQMANNFDTWHKG